MEVMIAVPLVLPDQPLALGDMETRVETWGRQVMRQALAAAWAAQAALRPAGPWPGLWHGGQRRRGHQTAPGRDGLRAGGVAPPAAAL